MPTLMAGGSSPLPSLTPEDPPLKRTPLYKTHVEHNARLVPFGGWEMPVQYSSIIDEHRTVRTAAGLFDLSHMGEFEVKGYQALDFLQYATTNDVSKLEVWQAQYNLMCYPDGGIVDDLIIYRLPDSYYVVVNASNIDKDLDWLNETAILKGFDMTLRDRSDFTVLLSVQGPKSQEILQPLISDLSLNQIEYYHCGRGTLDGVPAMIARTGYTGEDGFEIFISQMYGQKMWQRILEVGQPFGIKPIGLGARDSLRLEAKMALYGNDIDSTTNPLEAGLGWVVKLDKTSDFCGKTALQKIKANGTKRKLVGFEMRERGGIARHGYNVANAAGQVIGQVTSGGQSPTLEKAIGLAYVPLDHSAIGTPLSIMIRDKPVAAEVVKTPFYKRK